MPRTRSWFITFPLLFFLSSLSFCTTDILERLLPFFLPGRGGSPLHRTMSRLLRAPHARSPFEDSSCSLLAISLVQIRGPFPPFVME